MNITQMQCGTSAVVEEVLCERELRERLYSLNIRPNATVCLQKISLWKNTYLLQASGSAVALRKEVAACITVKVSGS